MKIFEFYAEVKDGKIEIPKQHLGDLTSHINVLAWNDEPMKSVDTEENKRKIAKLKGSLNHYANPDRIHLEEGAWRRAAVEKQS